MVCHGSFVATCQSTDVPSSSELETVDSVFCPALGLDTDVTVLGILVTFGLFVNV